MSQALHLEHYDLNIGENNASHHTELFGEERLIVRRGEPFNITLHVKTDSGRFPLDDNSFFLIAETGPSPTKESGTRVTFALQQVTDKTQWSASATYGPAENTIIVSISSSPNAPIGVYKLTLDQQDTKIPLGEFTLLFNAWCLRDVVYMPKDAKRQEYILEKIGRVYKGTFKRISETPWDFGQFEPDVLRICFKILDSSPNYLANANEDCSSRKDPIYVSRVLSAMINSNDDNGVLVGEWYEYPDGVFPWDWYGSAEILQRWDESGPVRYGQCWVFAAVACTVSRVLGIPCRVVTNFESAHDSNANLCIDNIYGMDGERISGGDSIWNFHVWVECWMDRPDLGSDFDGWQVCDPTPQETSDGVFCCGPAPVRAIKEGELTKKYDAPFIYAEVNADVVNWMYLPSGEKVKINVKSASVGRCISTKARGSTKRRDITNVYKYEEGSQEERHSYEKADHRNKLHQEGKEPGLNLKIKLAKDMVMGKDFEVCAQITNNCMETKACKVVFMASAVGYNGKLGEYCGFTMEEAVELAPNEVKHIPLKLEHKNYAPVITSERLIKVTLMTLDGEHEEYNTAVKTIVLDGPDIEIKLLGEARVNQPMAVELSMLNTLPEKLQDCSFIVQGTGLIAEKIETRIEPVGPKEEAKARVEFKPTTAGTCMLVVRFKSDKLSNVNQSLNIDVKE
ncbi:protein-glutamine gamma-glutamyltransferase 2-like [Nelusetta ayraudi]|uniref:protein-glutamine gamma-glutamyltransferase 2-like n=1 Tax=Nelusetta ayraudi TaxID=303726 RepID=UPI003F6FDA3E